MKRTATLVAGLLLVTGTVFGASEWKMTEANVEGTYFLTNSQTGSLGSEGGDLDVTFKTEKDFGKAGVVGVELGLEKDDDSELSFSYTKTEGDWTVGTGATLGKNGAFLPGDAMEKSSDTYIKWNVMGNKATALTFYPYEVDGMSFDEETFESFIDYAKPGLKLDTKVANTNIAFTIATTNGTTRTENQNTFKVAADTKVAGFDIKAAAGVGETTQNYSATDKTLVGKVTVANASMAIGTDYVKEGNFAAVQAKTTMGKISVLAEFNTENAEFKNTTGAKAKVAEVTQTGIYGKVSYDMGTMNTYKLTPYASLEITDYETKNAAGNKVTGSSDTLTDVEAGLDINQGSFTVTPKIVINKAADNKIFNEEKNSTAKTEKDATMVGIKFKYAL